MGKALHCMLINQLGSCLFYPLRTPELPLRQQVKKIRKISYKHVYQRILLSKTIEISHYPKPRHLE